MWSSRLLLAFIKARPIQCKVYCRSCCYYYFSTTLKKLSTHITSKKEKKKINFCFLLEKKVKKKAILQSLMAQPNGVDSKCPPPLPPASTSPPPPSLLSRLWSSLRLQKSQRPTIIPPTPSSNASTIQRTQSERRVVSNGNTNNHQNDIEGLCIKERPTKKQLQNQPSIRTWSTGNNDNGIRRKGGPLAAQELHSISDHHHYDHLGNKYENGQASPILSSARPRTPKPAPRFSLNNSLTTMTSSTGSKPNNLRSKRFRPG